jgi:2-polyprenyl-3-methyl-5-hydroxy-6-metoxy-1,4-benzoquinol methylase
MSESILERWRRRWLTAATAAAPAAVAAPVPARMPIDIEEILTREFPLEYPVAAAAADRVLAAIRTTDLAPLARRSPALHGYDWTGYIRCSVARVVQVQRALRTHIAPGARVLDFGSYFGNFALALAGSGYGVEAADSYDSYGPVFAPCTALMRSAGITVHDSGDSGAGLAPLAGRYDAVVCAGVLEHIPHTPRLLLANLTTLLKAGGVLVLDTPNLAYLYHRLALLEGRSVFAPIEGQFHTELPFEGHHREYTMSEVEWMLKEAGHDVLDIQTFNYSYLAQPEISGEHLKYFEAMQHDPTLREIIIAVSRPRSNGQG